MGFIKSLFKQGKGMPVLTGEYMGQEKPGPEPVVFVPGIVTTQTGEFAITFSPEGDEFYFTRHVSKGGGRGQNVIMTSKVENGQWTAPKTAPFSGKYFDFEPYITRDGKKLYFGSTRPLEGDGPPGELHQWFLEKTETGWSDPKPFGSPFKERFVMSPTEADNKNIYFAGMKKGTNDCELCISRWVDGKYEEPKRLSKETVNRFVHAAHPYIAPDESYLIFDAKITPTSTGNIFVCFKKDDGSWTKAEKMSSKINTEAEEGCASISPDGKYMFFSRNGNIHWVDANIIEEYRKE